ncbi:MAG: hypothetical protein OHK93_008509 [Ramalina farinacea]|uniref:Uncharacterized protein n=1 Tax=Ramalina farinacea TaxID=258253 RepID=A0AA43QMJ8_9LECA|nr:hypothetical protein [Ramalina farinacea]
MGRSKKQYLPDEEYDDGTPPAKGKKRVHRWTEVDTRVLPHAIQKALNNLGYPMPWDEIALELKNGQSGGAVAQHLAKDCAALKESGVKVPSPLKRGGNRNARQESLSITRLASVPFKVSKSGVNNLSQRANDKGARRNFKQNPSKSFQRDDTPPPHPRQNGQYKLARVPVPRMTPAFRQRELDPHPPPFFKPSAPAINGSTSSPRSGGPSAPAVDRSQPHSSPGPSAAAVIDLSDSETVQEDTDGSDSGSGQEITDSSTPKATQGVTDNEPVHEEDNLSAPERIHESSTLPPNYEEQFQLPDPEPASNFSMSSYLGQSWAQHVPPANNTPWSIATAHLGPINPFTGPNPYNYNFHDQTIDPAAFLENELSMSFQDCAASYL